MKRIICASALAATFAAQAGLNLIVDPEVNQTPLSEEFRLVTHEKEGRGAVSRFEEDLVWNGCVKLEVVSFGVSHREPRYKPKGSTGSCISSEVEIGGSAAEPGFAVRGGSKLKFGFLARGTAREVVVNFRIWTANGAAKTISTPIGRVKLTNAWSPVKGEIDLPAEAVRAALVVQLWYDEMYGPMIYKAGDYALLDKFDIQRKTEGRELWPQRAAVIPMDGSSVSVGALRSIVADVPAKVPTAVKVAADEKALTVLVDAPKASAWKTSAVDGEWMRFDDRVELFVGALDKPGIEAHFAVSSVGGRWASVQKNVPWHSKAVPKGDGYAVRFVIPWTSVGLAAAPKKGEPFAFQVCRTRVLGPVADPKGERGTSQGYARWLDDASWNFDNGDGPNKARWGVLFRGDMGALNAADPTASWAKFREDREAARLAALKRQPFVVAQVPTHAEAELPFMPEELYDPQNVFRAKAAGNERVSIAVVVANMTDESEDYRFLLTSGMWRPNPWNELAVERFGLIREDGTRFPEKNIRLLRAVRFRDADTPGHGKRFDPLTPLEGMSAVTVAPKETGLVWIEFDTHGVQPGLYKGSLSIAPLAAGCYRGVKNVKGERVFDDDAKVIPVEFEVRSFALPEPTDMALFSVARAYSEYAFDYLKDHYETRYMLTPWNFEADFDAEGNLIKRRPRPWTIPQIQLLDKNVPKIKDHPRLSVCYASYRHFRDEISKKQPYKFNTPQYWKAYAEWVKYVDDILVSNGIRRDDYLWELLDEPGLEKEKRGWNLFTVEEAKKSVTVLKEALPGARVYIASGVDAFFPTLKDEVDEWCFYQNLDRHYPMAREWAKTGKWSTEYDCNCSMRISAYRYFRMLPWKAAAAGGKYTVIYQFIFADPSMSIHQTPYGELAYDTGREMLKSIRGENLYFGMCDTRYLRYLETLAEKGTSETAKQARAYAAFALRDVPFTRPHDFLAADQFRDKASDFIERLLKEAR